MEKRLYSWEKRHSEKGYLLWFRENLTTGEIAVLIGQDSSGTFYFDLTTSNPFEYLPDLPEKDLLELADQKLLREGWSWVTPKSRFERELNF